MKKTNPRKIPRTQADVDKAFDMGFECGARDLLDVMVYTLGSDMEMSDEWLEFYHARFIKNYECHVHGELTTSDMRRTVYAEKGWEVELIDNRR